MRLWSIHPKYLDTKGLIALWRETLLAKHVLEGKTKGYRNHPQLKRFKKLKHPLNCINLYLSAIYKEAIAREYNFNKGKIDWNFKRAKLTVTSGQLLFERQHLLKKLKIRDPIKYKILKRNAGFQAHPIFREVPGDIEDWEVLPE